MRREFFVNIIFLIAVNLLIKPFFVFGIDRTVQNVVGAEQYGIYAALLNFSAIFQMLTDFGIQNFANRTIAAHKQLLNKYFCNLLVLKIILSIFYLLFSFTIAFLLGYNKNYFYILFFLLFNQIMVSYIFFFRANLSGLGFYRLDSLLSVLDRLLLILICSTLLWGNFFSKNIFRLEWFVYAQVVSLLLTTIISFLMIFKQLPHFKLQLNLPLLRVLMRQSYPFALIYFLMMTYTRMDMVLLERILPDGKIQAGIYASSFRLLDAANIVGLLFGNLLLPMFTRLLNEKKSIEPLLNIAFRLLIVMGIVFSFSVYFFRYDIMQLLYTYSSDGNLLGGLILTFIPMCATYILGALFMANNNLRSLNRIFFVAVLINGILNFWLIPTQKAMGAMISAGVVQVYVALALLWLMQAVFKFKPNYHFFFQIILFSTIFIFMYFLLKKWTNWNWKIQFITLLSTSLPIAIGVGLWDWRLLKNKELLNNAS